MRPVCVKRRQKVFFFPNSQNMCSVDISVHIYQKHYLNETETNSSQSCRTSIGDFRPLVFCFVHGIWWFVKLFSLRPMRLSGRKKKTFLYSPETKSDFVNKRVAIVCVWTTSGHNICINLNELNDKGNEILFWVVAQAKLWTMKAAATSSWERKFSRFSFEAIFCSHFLEAWNR